MFEQFFIWLGHILRKVPALPNSLLEIFQHLESQDSLGLFQYLIWLPFNVYVCIRLFQPSLKNEKEPSAFTYCLSALFVWSLWAYYNFGIQHTQPVRFVREFNPYFLSHLLLN
jgi:hypothetical protein